jgi:OPC-8:0 CoA ligase-1
MLWFAARVSTCRASPVGHSGYTILFGDYWYKLSKGVILTHANFIAIMTLLRWHADVSSANDDVFLCFIPMFHIYGLAFFVLGLLCVGTTTVVMQKFDFQAMLHAIKAHKVL